jgi:DNA-binding transcriptional LysR family regulator
MLYPDCNIVTRRLRPDQVCGALEKEETNLVFTPYDLISDSSLLFFYPLYHDRHYCVMEAANPFAKKKRLRFEELGGKHILLPSKAFRPAHIEPAMRALGREELHCKLDEVYNIDNALIQLLSHSDAIAIAPGFCIPEHPRLRAALLEDGTQIRVGLAYRQAMTHCEEAFALLARDHVAREAVDRQAPDY